MLTKRHILSAIIGATLCAATSLPAFAGGKSRSPASRPAPHSQPLKHKKIIPVIRQANQMFVQNAVSPAEAKSIARSRVKGGEVVDISRRGDTYRVRVIAKDGKVVDVYIDANTGRVKR